MLSSGHARAANLVLFRAASQSCGTWLQHPQEADSAHIVIASWVDGYLTGTNEKRWETGLPTLVGKSTDNNGRNAWITQYCQVHPLDALFVAARALVTELGKTGH